jgi:hypothetical protein
MATTTTTRRPAATKTAGTTTAGTKAATTKAAPTKAATTKAATTKAATTKAAPREATAPAARRPRAVAGVPLDVRVEDVRTALAEAAYAGVGLTDAALAIARDLPQRLEALRQQAPALLQELPTRARTEVADELEGARTALGDYTSRGRQVVGSIRDAAATRRALGQTEIARSQAKAAVTSIRKAVEQGQEVLEVATGRLGARRSA